MAYRVEYRRRAERDLEKLARNLSFDWYEMICEAVESLRVFPERCALVPEPLLRGKGTRHLLCGSGRGIYRIIYRVRDERVEILTIRHAHRRVLQRL